MPLPRPACLLPALLIASTVVHADEGMWTPDNFPAAMVRERLGVDITPEWLRHVRLATVRLSGCTASFVSPDGLMLTNHHCVASCLAQLSTAGNDLVHEGFIAAGRDGELRCPTQRADVLMGTQDITAEVQAAMARGNGVEPPPGDDWLVGTGAAMVAVSAMRTPSMTSTYVSTT